MYIQKIRDDTSEIKAAKRTKHDIKVTSTTQDLRSRIPVQDRVEHQTQKYIKFGKKGPIKNGYLQPSIIIMTPTSICSKPTL